jgi:HEAT repeat protein
MPEEMSFEYQGANLDIPNPPKDLSYADFDDFRYREILKANGVGLSEKELIIALGHKITTLQGAAAHTLGSLACQAAAVPLFGLLKSWDDTVQVEAAYALARLGVPEGKEALIHCLDYLIDAYLCPPIAAGYLARLGDSQGFPVIVQCLQEGLLPNRMLACKQLFFFTSFLDAPGPVGKSMDVFGEFERTLNDMESDIQWQAIVQLREIHAPQVKAILARYIGQVQDDQLRKAAQAILDS